MPSWKSLSLARFKFPLQVPCVCKPSARVGGLPSAADVQPHLGRVRDVAGSGQRAELGSCPHLPARRAPACAAPPHSATCVASPPDGLWDTEGAHK